MPLEENSKMAETTLKQQIYQSEEDHRQKLRRLESDTNILAENKQAIKDFLKSKLAEGITVIRANIILTSLIRAARLSTRPFAAFTEKDLREVTAALETKTFSPWTKLTTRTILKGLMKQLGKSPEVYAWVKNKRPFNTIRPEDLLTEEEMSRMVAATDSPMWKALLGVLFECGLRPGEALNMRVRDVVRNGNKYKLHVSGKTGPRVAYLYKNQALLESWLKIHTAKQDTSPLWLTEQGKPITLETLGVVYHKISNRGRIKRRNWPYLARHTRLTQIYRDHGSIIGSKLAGHVVGSREVRTYLHLSESDVEAALDAANGVIETAKPVDFQRCPACNAVNPYGEIFCVVKACGAPLNAAGSLVREDDKSQEAELLKRFTELWADKDVKAAFMETLEAAKKKAAQ